MLVRVRLIGYTNEWAGSFFKTAVNPGDDDVPILTSPVMSSFHDSFCLGVGTSMQVG